MANDGWASDYLRDLNTYGSASANAPRPSSVVSRRVQYQSPVAQTEAETNDTPLYSGGREDLWNIRSGQDSGWQGRAGGGYTAETFPSSGGSGRRYARPKRTQSRSRGSAPANGVKTRSAPLSGSDVTAAVMKAVKADGNTSFANWRQSLVNQGWSQAEADAVRYDPSTGKFMSNASGQAATDHHMREQADKDAGIMADNPEVEGKVSGQTPAKTEGGAQPAPASGAQPAPAKTEGSAQPAPADDHEQEVKAAVVEFLKQHPADGKERLKSIYEAVGSQNIKDDAAYNLAVLAEIQKAQTPAASGDTSDVDSILNNPGNTGAADSGKAVLLERQAQTESGVNDYQDQIREGINWLRMFHAPDDPAGVRAEAVITAIGNMVRSSDPERYKHAVEELEKQKSYVIAANNEQIANDITEGSKVLWGDPEKAAEYVRQLRAANAAKAQAAAEAAEQRSDNPEGWL